MEVAELTQLETDINTLIQKIQRLNYENMGLKQQLKQAAKEHKRLSIKQLKAADQVKAIVKRLKGVINE